MKLIVGLGNPGREYAGTRHNIGFGVIARLSDEYHISLNSKEHKAVCGKGFIEGEKVILAQPQTFMNLSGESVRSTTILTWKWDRSVCAEKEAQADTMASKILFRILERTNFHVLKWV